MRAVFLIYVLGVATGLLFTDARPLTRVGLALAWPIAPLAFVAVLGLLLVAALYIFPIFGAVVAASAVGLWLLLR